MNRMVLLRGLRGLAGAVLSIAVLIALWQFLVKGLHLDPFLTRGPLDVWNYLTQPPADPYRQAAVDAQRHALLDASRETALDAVIGMVAGTLAGLVAAMAFALWRAVQQSLLPAAMALRAVPLVALAPLIALIFGRSLLGVTVITGIVTFFPVLVNVSLALRSVSSSNVDLLHAYGGGRFSLMWLVQLPAALPALFAATRIAAPLALVGALLAEWLSTGKGLGYLMLTSLYSFKIDQMWTAVALVTIASIILYAIISFIESVVLARFSYPRS